MYAIVAGKPGNSLVQIKHNIIRIRYKNKK
jgi:hypothetical protein